jgi:pimeloyl-ACP methyl ester carboxylesterase
VSGDFLASCYCSAWGAKGVAMQTRFVTTSDGVELCTVSTGQPERGTILLAMGATASMAWWPDSMIARLAEGSYQVIQFDHRDTGQSTTNPPGDVRYDIFDLASDLIAILDAYEVKSANLVGMSLGGYVSQIAALKHPERVRSLTLIASEPLGIAYEGEGISDEVMQHFSSMAELDWSNHQAVVGFMLKIAELSAGSVSLFDREVALRRIERELQRTSSMQSAFNHAIIAGELRPHLDAGKLDLPVLIVHGSEDPIIPASAAHTSAAIIKGAQLLLLEGRGHELLDADLPLIAEAILMLATRQD